MARGYVDTQPGAGSGGLPIKTIVLAVIAFFGLLTLYSGYYKTNAGYEDIVIRFGAPVRTSEPGPHWKLPYVEGVHPVEIRDRKYVVKLEAASKDPMELPIEVALNWKVNREHVIQMYSQYGELSQFEERIIAPRLPDAVKGVISTFSVNQLLTERVKLRTDSLNAAKSVIPEAIMTITGFSVTNVQFPKAYTDQIARVQVAREAANEESEVSRKQGYTVQQKVNTANAEASAVKAAADGEAYAIKAKALADAERIVLTGKSVNDNLERQAKILAGSSLLVEYKRAETWKGDVPTTFMGGDASATTLWNMPGGRLATPKQ